MQVKKQQLELVMEQQYGVNRYKLLYIKQISNRIYKELYSISSEYIMRNVGLEETQTRIKIARRNINNLRYAEDTTLTAESKEELKSPLMKEESEKVGLKLNIQKIKIMASVPSTSWQTDGETMETMRDFIFGAPKSWQMVTAAMK